VISSMQCCISFRRHPPNIETALESAHFWLLFRGPRRLSFAVILKGFAPKVVSNGILEKTAKFQIPVGIGGQKHSQNGLPRSFCLKALTSHMACLKQSCIGFRMQSNPTHPNSSKIRYFWRGFRGPRSLRFAWILMEFERLGGFRRYSGQNAEKMFYHGALACKQV